MTEWDQVKAELRAAGVAGVDEFGRFVNNTRYFAPSAFDEAGAAPVLLRLLPHLTDERTVRTVARHLQNRAAGKSGYEVVRQTFERWATKPGEAGWVLGDTLARMADKSRCLDFVHLAADRRLGAARAFIVDALWRFKSVTDVEPLLRVLILDEDVRLYALSALQRVVGAERMRETLLERLAAPGDDDLRRDLTRQLRRVEKKLRSSAT